MKAQNNQANRYFKEMAKQHNCTLDEFIEVYYS